MSDDQHTERIAIVGAGPAGFYAADQLLKQGLEVDLYDALPTPYGLVRAGVAPDHPKIKSVTRAYAKTAAKEGFRFFGGVALGEHVTRAELLERYHGVVYAFGSATDNRLGIPGEDLEGSYAATEFVAWYNAHPDFAGHEYDLSGGRAVVVGNGNVAIDVARMLVLTPDEVSGTDTADHAIEAFGDAGVDEVVLLGRRGPAQAAFTNPELRELGELTRADVIVDPADLVLDADSEAWLQSEDAHTTNRKNVEILRDYAGREPKGHSHRVVLRFLRSPLEVLGDEEGRVRGLRIGINRIERRDDGRLAAVPTGREEEMECGLVLRSIGYRGSPVCTVPFDAERGLVRNDGGRVVDDEGEPLPGEYATGWIKRGPSGVIGTNKKDSADTTAKLLCDREAGRLNVPSQTDPDAIEPWLRERAPGLGTWEDWEAIDAHETAAGEAKGRPRVKLVDRDEMARVGAGASAQPAGR
ncbi:MAG: FAD-dependent oxidoreductase [Actinomycetota bacterium]|nr:FAD-dependent oxidoreductase [Actinomycetota bacterium]